MVEGLNLGLGFRVQGFSCGFGFQLFLQIPPSLDGVQQPLTRWMLFRRCFFRKGPIHLTYPYVPQTLRTPKVHFQAPLMKVVDPASPLLDAVERVHSRFGGVAHKV